jgi:putative FmdB family regulatory protein
MRVSRERENMPLYEYECDACGRRFERIQKFSDPPISVCPTCGGAVRKLFSSPAIQFKGSGFYITDYPKSGAGAEGAKGKSPEPSTSSAGDSGEASSKPAAATESKSSESSTKAEPAKTPAGSTTKT